MEKLILILVYLFLNWLYLPLSRRSVKYYWRLKIDDKIPLVPWMLVPYVSYALFFIGGSLVLIFSEQFFLFIKTMIFVQFAANIIWYLFPNGVKRPSLSGQGLMIDGLRKLYLVDKHDANGFPSAHAFHSMIVAYFLAQQFPVGAGLIYVWVTLILTSTVLTKQHYILDLVGGVALAAIGLWV